MNPVRVSGQQKFSASFPVRFLVGQCFQQHGPLRFPVRFRFVFSTLPLFSTTSVASFPVRFRFVFWAHRVFSITSPVRFLKKEFFFLFWSCKTALKGHFPGASARYCSLSLLSLRPRPSGLCTAAFVLQRCGFCFATQAKPVPTGRGATRKARDAGASVTATRHGCVGDL